MERTNIEQRIVQLLTEVYPESEYKALVVATAIIDLLIVEEIIKLNSPE